MEKATTRTLPVPVSIKNSRESARCRRSRSRGFTLVEILVVVVIMAIVISIAVLSINVTGRDQQLDEESERLAGLLGLLHDRALLEGRDFGLHVEPGAYEFLVYDNLRERWAPFDQDGEFRPRSLPKGISVELQLDSVQVVLKPADTNLSPGGPAAPPQIAIAASGECTPFRLTLLRGATQVRAVISGDAFGKTTRGAASRPAKPS